jgi:phosphoglucosamine mutase
MNNLFGTDGIRGKAGVPPLDSQIIYRVGRALARQLAGNSQPRVLIGRDTRESGSAIETWLASGVAAGGGEPVSAGVISTPAVAYLTRRFGFSAGVVISASHNPWPDNGVKIFSNRGSKSSETLEIAISEDVATSDDDNVTEASTAPSSPDPSLQAEYIQFLKSTLPPNTTLGQLSVALDCANGATYQVGPRLLQELGLKVVPRGVSPNGKNINKDCGSTHLEGLSRLVLESRCDFGAALDGDGDRLLLVDEKGQVVNGDAILLMCARHMKANGRLSSDAVVATVMSNLALEQALRGEGIRLSRTQVGDKYVAAEMERCGLVLGGEQSGHVIFSEYSPTGDGLLTLLQVLRVLVATRKPLSDAAYLEPLPQVLVNVPVNEKRDVHQVPEIARAMADAEKRMAGRGRLLVRFSGTEPLLRIMLEGPDEGEIRALSASIADATRRSLADS